MCQPSGVYMHVEKDMKSCFRMRGQAFNSLLNFLHQERGHGPGHHSEVLIFFFFIVVGSLGVNLR